MFGLGSQEISLTLKAIGRRKSHVNRTALLAGAVCVALVIAAAGYFALNPGTAKNTTGQTKTNAFASSSQSVTSTSAGCDQAESSYARGWTTYHGNNSRSGYVAAAVVCPKEGWKSAALDGEVYAEPLVYDGMVLVATENDSVYALNATSGFILWRTNLGTPVPGSALPCGDISPSGITGTPVIDQTTDTIYVVAFQTPGEHYLVAVDVKDGGVRFSQLADPLGSDPLVQQERGALSFGNGRVYIPYGGLDGDCGDYHGWVVGLNADGSGGMISYEVPSQREAGIWAPSGGAMDSSGDLFVATGNGASDGAFDYGNSVVELSPSLRPLGYFAPTDWPQLNQGDTDLGSVGPAFVNQSVLFQIGKEGVGYLLNSANLGGIGGQEFSEQVCSSSFGGTAVSGSTVFVPCTDGLVALLVSSNSFQVLWKDSGFPSGPPIVTGKVVWGLDTSSGVLNGYNSSTGAGLFTFNVGGATRFTTPSVGDGSVFVAAGEYLYSFQLS